MAIASESGVRRFHSYRPFKYASYTSGRIAGTIVSRQLGQERGAWTEKAHLPGGDLPHVHTGDSLRERHVMSIATRLGNLGNILDEAPERGGELAAHGRAERFEIMRRWVDSGGSAKQLARRMGWHDGRYGPSSVGHESHSGDAQTTDRKAS